MPVAHEVGRDRADHHAHHDGHTCAPTCGHQEACRDPRSRPEHGYPRGLGEQGKSKLGRPEIAERDGNSCAQRRDPSIRCADRGHQVAVELMECADNPQGPLLNPAIGGSIPRD